MNQLSSGMNVFDIVLALPLLWMAYRGFTRGFIIGIVSLVAFILGLYLSIKFSGVVSQFITEKFNTTSPYLSLISFVGIFLAVVIVLFLFGKMLEKVIDLLALGFLNKLLGGLLGFAKAVILVSLILFIFNILDTRQRIITDKMRQESFLYEPLAKVFPALLQILNIHDLILKKPAPPDTTVPEKI
jgi:membrane protein required for colicin V production